MRAPLFALLVASCSFELTNAVLPADGGEAAAPVQGDEGEKDTRGLDAGGEGEAESEAAAESAPAPVCADETALTVFGDRQVCDAAGCDWPSFRVPCGAGEVCCQGACRATRWEIETVPDGPGDGLGSGSLALAVGDDGTAHVAFLTAAAVRLWQRPPDGGWTVGTLAGVPGAGIAVAVDPDGGPQVVYAAPEGVVHWRDDAFSTVRALDPDERVGSPSLAVEPDPGVLHVAYLVRDVRDGGGFAVEYASSPLPGGAWGVPEVVASSAETATHEGTAVALQGGVVIAFPAPGGRVRVARHIGGAGWVEDGLTGSGDVSGMTRDAAGTLHLLYGEGRYAFAAEDAGWMEGAALVAGRTSAPAVLGGELHAAFTRSPIGVELASLPGGGETWSVEAVDPLAPPARVALAAAVDTLHVAYDAPDGLRYARRLACGAP